MADRAGRRSTGVSDDSRACTPRADGNGALAHLLSGGRCHSRWAAYRDGDILLKIAPSDTSARARAAPL